DERTRLMARDYGSFSTNPWQEQEQEGQAREWQQTRSGVAVAQSALLTRRASSVGQVQGGLPSDARSDDNDTISRGRSSSIRNDAVLSAAQQDETTIGRGIGAATATASDAGTDADADADAGDTSTSTSTSTPTAMALGRSQTPEPAGESYDIDELDHVGRRSRSASLSRSRSRSRSRGSRPPADESTVPFLPRPPAHPHNNDSDDDDDDDDGTGPGIQQRGVREMDAIGRVWTQRTLATAYAGIFLISLSTSLEAQTTASLAAYATSAFATHSSISLILVVQNVINAVIKPPIAKVADVFGRLEAFALSIAFYVAGYGVMSAARGLAAYAAAQILYSVGATGVQILSQVFIADSSGLLNR
ncbi:hypothetical protein KEM52_002429, partial [Ascosphaera acerosa]